MLIIIEKTKNSYYCQLIFEEQQDLHLSDIGIELI